MPTGAKRLPAVFYRSESGDEPVRDWLKSDLFSKDDRRRIGTDIKTVEFGWPVGMPVCRPLGHGLWEVRTRLAHRIVRIMFFVASGRMVLAHGFVKKARAAPRDDIALAFARKRRWENEA